ncbi:TPA: hypothetical protein DCZ15_00890 [Candidatus Falkowbacteria bacterium]|nr:MAG: Glycosyl transferase, WecB/TagA/CpsF family [Candidatus Falkowbacteria bacterium GW2011_GWF2_43_32]HBA36411.1 hypothetical protein [Candidatus Falkowbacteria bacterium]
MANILGINLSELKRGELDKKIAEFLSGGHHYLVTPNPEIILAAHRDEELFYILNRADLVLADGFGLKVAGWLNACKISRFTGADLTLKLLQTAAVHAQKVMILNWQDGLSRATDIEAALRRRWPALNCRALDIERSPILNETTRATINAFAPTILFCTFGSPFQEKTVYHNLSSWPSVRLALGVGGAFDFITEKIKRAPKFFRIIGLEWLWRLIKQPKRIRRIYNATLVFMMKALRARFVNIWLYRPNVACLLYKKTTGTVKILLVEREDEPGHWQLPQGGLDGESLTQAGTRELREEVGATAAEVRATFKNLYRYKFTGNRKFGHDKTRTEKIKTEKNKSNKLDELEQKRYKYDYKGQKQGLCVAEFLGNDRDLQVNFWDHRAWKWVEADRLTEEVHPVRRPAAEIFLEKFKSLNL